MPHAYPPRLTPRQALFVREYLVDLNYRQAALRAGYSDGHHRLLDSEVIRQAIDAEMSARAARVGIDPDEVLREIHAIATADTNEIIEYRRVCCHYCWGTGFRYQYTTEDKLRAAQRAFDKTIDALVEHFPHGGIGFDPRREPNVDCPECYGEGFGEVYAKDTRLLSAAARALYAGVKVTKDGIEVKMHSKDKHLELLARHLGLLNDKLDVKGSLNVTVATGVPDPAEGLV